VAVVIASTGRPGEVGQILERLARQTYKASKVVVSIVNASDLPAEVPPGTLVLTGTKGATVQRNRGLELVLGEVDLVAFCDDDYLPSRRALQGIVALFSAHPDVVGANGTLLADGINSAGISYDDAVAMIERHDALADPPDLDTLVDLDGLYGCNMVFRTSAIGDVRFDEALPLYGWQEDIDFAAQLRPRGRIVMSRAFAGVHRGVKGARTSGRRFGYSQVANPIYLTRKGTMRAGFAFRIVAKNVLANHIRVWRPEPWVDRMGRVRGNWMAFADTLSGRAHPGRILQIE
jgi:glycosyltransferase involved in cell wall biosynthesis